MRKDGDLAEVPETLRVTVTAPKDTPRIVLSEAAIARVLELLEAPPEPNARLLSAAGRYAQ